MCVKVWVSACRCMCVGEGVGECVNVCEGVCEGVCECVKVWIFVSKGTDML